MAIERPEAASAIGAPIKTTVLARLLQVVAEEPATLKALEGERGSF